MCRLLAMCLVTAGVSPCVLAVRFPDDAGVVFVTDFGATPDDDTDDTEAIQAAITHAIETSNRYASPKICYLTAGEYLVSGPIEGRVTDRSFSQGWRAGMVLFGDGPHATTLRLIDNAPGYESRDTPKWIVATGSENRTRGNEGRGDLGGGNEAFHHHLEGFTIDVGRGNPGAVALDYVANNRGAVVDVTLRAPEGSGWCGLSLERWWPGPCFIRRMTIEGFDYAIRTDHYQYGVTFEDLTLSGQRVACIDNSRNVLAIHRMRSDNSVPVLEGDTRHGLVVIVDGLLRGDDPTVTAIDTENRLYLRDVRTPGYGVAVRDRTAERRVVGPGIDFYASSAVGLEGEPKPLRLEIRDAPHAELPPVSTWTNAADFGAKPDDDIDDADSLQHAIDAVAGVLYLPNGDYRLSRPLRVRGAVTCILGMQASLSPHRGDEHDSPLIRFEGEGGAATRLQFLRINGAVEHRGKGALVIAHSIFRGYSNTKRGTGDLFLEDTIGTPIRVLHPQRVWGRQVNTEFAPTPLIENHGGTVWLLGHKTEGNREVAPCLQRGGRSEVLGGLYYNTARQQLAGPVWLNQGGDIALTLAQNGRGYRRWTGRQYGSDAEGIEGPTIGGRVAALIRSKAAPGDASWRIPDDEQ